MRRAALAAAVVTPVTCPVRGQAPNVLTLRSARLTDPLLLGGLAQALALPRPPASQSATRAAAGAAIRTYKTNKTDAHPVASYVFCPPDSLRTGTRTFKLAPVAALALESVVLAAHHASVGELVPWDIVRVLFPVGSVATVIDQDTGLSFRVRRYGGNWHADVEPLTTADTAVFQRIYTGWSWSRRAALVVLDGRRIAASMNGMPHGSGRIGGNRFSGHFCLHFLFSRTHVGGRIDPAHTLMVLRAAGIEPEAPTPAAAATDGPGC